MSEPKRIVFGVDFSEMTDAVIAAAGQAAKGYDSPELHAVCVLEPSGNPLAPEADVSEVHKLEGALKARVASAMTAPRDVTCHVCVGSVSKEVADLAAMLKAELIVIGRHGHSASPFVVGSAPVKLLQLAHCSVLVVHPASYA